jgi:excisionase family DNA binding protein
LRSAESGDFLNGAIDDLRQGPTAERTPQSPESSCLLKPADVADRLAVSRSWVYAAAEDGRLPSIRLGGPEGPLRFVAEELEEWIEEARSGWRLHESGGQTLRRVSRPA